MTRKAFSVLLHTRLHECQVDLPGHILNSCLFLGYLMKGPGKFSSDYLAFARLSQSPATHCLSSHLHARRAFDHPSLESSSDFTPRTTP